MPRRCRPGETISLSIPVCVKPSENPKVVKAQQKDRVPVYVAIKEFNQLTRAETIKVECARCEKARQTTWVGPILAWWSWCMWPQAWIRGRSFWASCSQRWIPDRYARLVGAHPRWPVVGQQHVDTSVVAAGGAGELVQNSDRCQ